MYHTDRLKNNIKSIVRLSDKDFVHIISLFEKKTLKKNDYLLKEGEVCDLIAFVNQGTLIYYKTLDSGSDITTDFAFQNDWVTDNYSRLNKFASHLNIKAIEDTELFIIKDKDLGELYNNYPELERFGRILMEQAFLKMTQLSLDLQTLSAKERYLKLLDYHPDITQKISLYHIANYLGIAPKSLSRIRNTIFHKE